MSHKAPTLSNGAQLLFHAKFTRDMKLLQLLIAKPWVKFQCAMILPQGVLCLISVLLQGWGLSCERDDNDVAPEHSYGICFVDFSYSKMTFL